MIVRRERPDDAAAVDALTRAAFGRDVEADLTAALRADPKAYIPALSLVAERDGAVVGHVIATRAHADATPLLGLGPVAVVPERQRTGVGSALLHAVLAAADARDEPAVVLLGDPGYYARFGFVLAATRGIAPPQAAWAPHFQVRTLAAWRPETGGTFAFAAPFDAAG